MFGIIVTILVSCTVVSGQFLNCGYVNSLDCNRYPALTMCGTDGKDYTNRCELAKAQCKDSNLHTVDEGSCASVGYVPPGGTTAAPMMTAGASTSGPVSTTMGTTREPIFGNHNQLLDFFCLELMHETCPNDTEKVCGTDNVTYDNFCEYEKQRCTHNTLQVKNFGDCV